jgi:peptidase MA superfamily protein
VSLAALLLAAAVALAGGEARERVTAPGVIVDFPSGRKAAAEATARVYVASRDDLASRLGVEFRRDATIQLFDTDAEFIAAVASHRVEPWVAAVAIPAEARIVVRGTTPDAHTSADYVPLLRHEVCHLLVGSTAAESRRRIPLWFDEGLAQWAAARLVVEEADVALLDRYGFLIPFVQLEDRYPESSGDARIAYLQSESLVRYVIDTRGIGVVRETLRRVRGGEAFDDAFEEAAHAHFFEIEREWKAWLHSEFSLPYLVARSLPFFAVVALVVVLAWLVRRARSRVTMQRMAREEAESPEAFEIPDEDEPAEPKPL